MELEVVAAHVVAIDVANRARKVADLFVLQVAFHGGLPISSSEWSEMEPRSHQLGDLALVVVLVDVSAPPLSVVAIP